MKKMQRNGRPYFGMRQQEIYGAQEDLKTENGNKERKGSKMKGNNTRGCKKDGDTKAKRQAKKQKDKEKTCG